MSGPVTTRDTSPDEDDPGAEPCEIEVTESREAQVGPFPVRRALPRRARRTVGAWCFVDHMGPAHVTEDRGLDVGPHPHIGLQTVTWLLEGEALHRDSLGSEQLLRPGQLNLMTAGRGVSHSEEATGAYRGDLHGVQLWIAQPEATRDGPPTFEHHAELPRLDLGDATLTLLVGELEGRSSPARRDTEHLGVDVDLRVGTVVMPLRTDFEHAVVVFDGACAIGPTTVVPGRLAYLGPGRDELQISADVPTRALLVGGVPFPSRVTMWWNYVARTHHEIDVAHRQWIEGDERFGHVASPLPRMTTGDPPWAGAG